MRTIRSSNSEKLMLRLVERNGTFIGVIIGQDGGRKAMIEGDDPDDIWRRLHDEAGKANPRYFRFDGALTRLSNRLPVEGVCRRRT